MPDNNSSRRQFLKRASVASAAAMSFPYIVPSHVLGKDGAVAPSNKIVMGAIGTGGKGRNNMGHFYHSDMVQMVAVCDVDKTHLAAGKKDVDEYYKNTDCETYTDFREVVARKDIDAVSIATPDHWHGLTSLAALNAGKDVYCEKPLTNTIIEGRAMCDAVKKNNRILQCGSHERSNNGGRYAAELVRNGRIGKLKTIRINLPCSDGHHKNIMELNKLPHPEQPIPAHFDYDRWLGPTASQPYHVDRCHFNWRFILAYGGGEMTDRGAHVIDIAQLCGNYDSTGPVEFKAEGSRSTTGMFDTFMDYKFECTYADGVKMIGGSSGERGLKLEGEKGSIFIGIHGCNLRSDTPKLLEEKIGDDEIKVGRNEGHHYQFLQCVKSRKQPFATAEIGHRTASICHLLNIAMLTGKTLKWDPATERITNDAVADSMTAREMRKPWHL